MSVPSKSVFVYSWEIKIVCVYHIFFLFLIIWIFNWWLIGSLFFAAFYHGISSFCSQKWFIGSTKTIIYFWKRKNKMHISAIIKPPLSNSLSSVLVKVFVMQTIIRFVLCSNIYVYMLLLCISSFIVLLLLVGFQIVLFVISEYWGIIFCVNIF